MNIVAGVNAGSKDETDETSGLVHLLEHYVLFRGTDLEVRKRDRPGPPPPRGGFQRPHRPGFGPFRGLPSL
ncbi:MAG: hypothetical protein MZV70_69030, partial [Desulfobacterales bacterium]|nr:hypothetical protein [Desulfobacterales bacterium]